MKSFKLFSIVALAALLFTPSVAMAKTHVSFSLNLFDTVRPFVMAPPPRPIIARPPPVVVVPQPVIVAPPPVVYPAPQVYYYPAQPQYQQRVIVKEYHYYHPAPNNCTEDLNPSSPYNHRLPHN